MAPFLPQKASPKEYTLVLDMDETLIHFDHEAQDTPQAKKDGGTINVRPGAQEFLRAMSEEYELVIFTAARQDYADWVLDRLDTDNLISHRLYRQHVSNLDDGGYLKDLALIGRPLEKTLIVDNKPSNFDAQPANGIDIKDFYDDIEDIALYELGEILLSIVNHPSHDLRVALAEAWE